MKEEKHYFFLFKLRKGLLFDPLSFILDGCLLHKETSLMLSDNCTIFVWA